MTAWLSISDAAAILGTGAHLVYRFINDGDLTAYRFGRVYRIRAVDIDAFLEAVRVKPGDLDHLMPKYDGPRQSAASTWAATWLSTTTGTAPASCPTPSGCGS